MKWIQILWKYTFLKIVVRNIWSEIYSWLLPQWIDFGTFFFKPRFWKLFCEMSNFKVFAFLQLLDRRISNWASPRTSALKPRLSVSSHNTDARQTIERLTLSSYSACVNTENLVIKPGSAQIDVNFVNLKFVYSFSGSGPSAFPCQAYSRQLLARFARVIGPQ